jgi:hypothetical protein
MLLDDHLHLFGGMDALNELNRDDIEPSSLGVRPQTRHQRSRRAVTAGCVSLSRLYVRKKWEPTSTALTAVENALELAFSMRGKLSGRALNAF